MVPILASASRAGRGPLLASWGRELSCKHHVLSKEESQPTCVACCRWATCRWATCTVCCLEEARLPTQQGGLPSWYMELGEGTCLHGGGEGEELRCIWGNSWAAYGENQGCTLEKGWTQEDSPDNVWILGLWPELHAVPGCPEFGQPWLIFSATVSDKLLIPASLQGVHPCDSFLHAALSHLLWLFLTPAERPQSQIRASFLQASFPLL